MKINKTLLAFSMASTMFAAQAVEAADLAVSGFVDVIYTVTNDGQAASPPATSTILDTRESQFVADGEVDFVSTVGKATVRLDVDFGILPGVVGSAAQIEQAHIAVPIGGATLIAGVLNNPVGYEAHDAPDLDFTTHNMIWDILDDQTVLAGNNVAGAAVAFAAGPATVTLAFVNDIGQFPEENSIAAVVNFAPMKGLDLEIGVVTQDDSAPVGTAPLGLNTYGSAGTVVDVNAVWTNGTITAGADFMTFGQLLDPAMVVWAGTNIGDINVKVRFESVAVDSAVIAGLQDAEQTTFYVGMPLSKNTSVALEVKDGDIAASGLATVLPSSVEGSLITAEFIGTF